MWPTTIVSLVLPRLSSPRKATQRLPAAVGQLPKPGPAKPPPPGAASPAAATFAFEVACIGRADASSAKPLSAATQNERRSGRCGGVMVRRSLRRRGRWGEQWQCHPRAGGVLPGLAHGCTSAAAAPPQTPVRDDREAERESAHAWATG